MEIGNNHFTSIHDIRYVCSHIFGLLKIPINFLSSKGDLIFEFSYEYSQNPLYKNYDELFNQFKNSTLEVSPAAVYSTNFFETFAFIRVTDENNMGTIILDPCLQSEIDDKAIDELVKDYNIHLKHRKELLRYYRHMILISYENLTAACSLLYYSIYRKQLDKKFFIENNGICLPSPNHKENDFDSFRINNREDSFFHHTQKYENELFASNSFTKTGQAVSSCGKS